MRVDLGLVAAVPGPYQGGYLLAGQPGEFIQQGLGPLILVVVLERSGGQYPGIRPEVEVDRTQCELPWVVAGLERALKAIKRLDLMAAGGRRRPRGVRLCR